MNINDGYIRNWFFLKKNFVDYSEKFCESGINMIVMIFFLKVFFYEDKNIRYGNSKIFK